MPNIAQKRRLTQLLKKLGGESAADYSFMDGVLSEVEKVRKMIPSTFDVAPINREFKEIKEKISSHTSLIVKMIDGNEDIKDTLKSLKVTDREIERILKDNESAISKSIESIEQEIKKLKLLPRGGGAKPLQISVNGTVANVRYADINIKNSGATVVNNDTTKQTDITITGGGGGSGFQQPLTGGLTGTNTWTTAPNVLTIDGIERQKVQTDGTVNWTGTTTTVLTGAPLPTFDIFSPA